MPKITREDVFEALAHVRAAGMEADVVSAGMIGGVIIKGANVGFSVEITEGGREEGEALRRACEDAVRTIKGVEKVTAVLTAEGGHAPRTPPLPQQVAERKAAVWHTEKLPHVKKIIAVASGKGGVGKSTCAVGLAAAFAATGARAGLLDADIYGPSIPRMLGLSGKPEIKDGKIQPLKGHGIICMSMGFIAGEGAVVWRGAMVGKALHQMLRGVAWGTETAPLDVLFVDMPPGTGDIALSMAQYVPLDGAVLVTTPQDVAVDDARKAAQMWERVKVPLLGVIENMSWFEPAPGQRHALFGEGGGARLAQEFGVPLLGQVPLLPDLGKAADTGAGAPAGAFARIAESLINGDPA